MEDQHELIQPLNQAEVSGETDEETQTRRTRLSKLRGWLSGRNEETKAEVAKESPEKQHFVRSLWNKFFPQVVETSPLPERAEAMSILAQSGEGEADIEQQSVVRETTEPLDRERQTRLVDIENGQSITATIPEVEEGRVPARIVENTSAIGQPEDTLTAVTLSSSVVEQTAQRSVESIEPAGSVQPEVVPRQTNSEVALQPLPLYELRRHLERKIEREAKKLGRRHRKERRAFKKELKQPPLVLEQVTPTKPETSYKIEKGHSPAITGEGARPRIFDTQPAPRMAENTPAVLLERVERPAEAKSVLAPESVLEGVVKEVKPDEIMLERVREAADHDEAVEQRLERRHEIKDENSRMSGAAVPIGKVVADTVAHTMSRQAEGSTAASQLRQLTAQQQKEQTANPELYALAMKRGLWAGITLVVFAVIAYLIMR